MLRDKDIEIQLYLHSQEAGLGIFTLRCMQAKIINKAACIKHRIWFDAETEFLVTPQEELFAEFFNSEKAVVADMSILELRAHREELAKIAFEARARLTAVDDEERSRKAKAQREKGPTGFSTSLQTDEITSEAINRVKERQKKLTKQEKTVEGLVKLGMDRKDAEKLVSAGTILARIKDKAAIQAPINSELSRPVINPFAKKEEQPKHEISIIEETNTVVIRDEHPEQPTNQSTFKNPFAK